MAPSRICLLLHCKEHPHQEPTFGRTRITSSAMCAHPTHSTRDSRTSVALVLRVTGVWT